MKNLSHGLTLALCSLAFVACGDRDAKDIANEVENRVQGNDIMGTWTTECHDSDLLDVSEQQEVDFSGSQLTYVRSFFDDDDCTSPAFTLEYTGSFEIEDLDNTNPAEAKALNLTYKEVRVTPKSEGGKDLLEKGFCGRDEWTVDESVTLTEVSNDGLCPLSSLPVTKYDLYHVSDDRLHLGTSPAAEGATTEDERPTEIDHDVALERQN